MGPKFDKLSIYVKQWVGSGENRLFTKIYDDRAPRKG